MESRSYTEVLTEQEITQRINDNNCRISNLASEFNTKSENIKNHIISIMGERIVFKRGRNGGIHWSQPQ